METIQDGKIAMIKRARKLMTSLKDLYPDILGNRHEKTKSLYKSLKQKAQAEADVEDGPAMTGKRKDLQTLVACLTDLDDKARKKAVKPFLKE